MPGLDYQAIDTYLANIVNEFHQDRIRKLEEQKLSDILSRKNPYLFKAKNVRKADELIEGVLDALLSSSEETLFGKLFEGLAKFVGKQAHGAYKSGIAGIDLEFEKDNVRYLINLKSGPNWGNSSQIKKMQEYFNAARKTLRTTQSANNNLQIVAVNGCCYGRTKTATEYRPEGDYYKYSGQRFWAFISGDADFYLKIVAPLSLKAEEKDEEFKEAYSKVFNRLVRQFTIEFCDESGAILWDKLIRFNSEAK